MPDRVLIIANALITNARQSLPTSLRQHDNHAREVLVIAPMLTTRLQCLTSDIDDAHHAAQQRLRDIAADMSTFRTPPLTTIGDENQVLAVADALATSTPTPALSSPTLASMPTTASTACPNRSTNSSGCPPPP